MSKKDIPWYERDEYVSSWDDPSLRYRPTESEWGFLAWPAGILLGLMGLGLVTQICYAGFKYLFG